MWPATSSRMNSVGSRSTRVTAVSGRPSRPWRASGSVAVTAPSTGIGASGSRKGEVEVDRAGADLAARPRQRPAGDRAQVQEAGVVGVVGADFAEPADRFAEGLDLVDRLARADAAQLRRPVGAEDDQRHADEVGLGDGGVVVGERRPRGAEQRHRLAARLRRAEREEPGRALVEDHRHLDPRLPPQRHRERRRARPRRDDRPPQPAARQLLGEGRGERGVVVGRVHRMGCGAFCLHATERLHGRSESVVLQRILVDRRCRARAPAPRAGGRPAARTRSRRSSRRRVAASRGRGRASRRRSAARRSPRASRRPRRSRPGRRARWRRRRGGPVDPQPRLDPADLRDLHPGHREAPAAHGPRRVLDGDDALVARQRDRDPPRQLRRFLDRLDRLLDQLDPERLDRRQDLGRLARATTKRSRRAGSSPRPRAPRARPAPAPTSSPAPTFSLNVPNPSAAQRSASAATSSARPVTSVALQRTGCALRASSPRAASRRGRAAPSSARSGPGRESAASLLGADHRLGPRGRSVPRPPAPAPPSRSSPRPAATAAPLRPAPRSPSSSLIRSSTISRRVSGPRAVT